MFGEDIHPQIILLERCNFEHWKDCERKYISEWRERNPNLLNKLNGGNGQGVGGRQTLCGNCGQEKTLRHAAGYMLCALCTRARNSAYNHSPKVRARRAEYQKHSPQRRAYLFAYHRTEEYRQSQRLRDQSPGRRERNRVRQQSQECRAYQQEYQKHYRQTPEAKYKARTYQQAPKWKEYQKKYQRDYHAAKKLGLTVPQYRQNLQEIAS